MKKTIGIMLLMLFSLISIVSAGEIEDLNYNDRIGWGWDTTRTTNDYDVYIDADKLSGKTIDEISQNVYTTEVTEVHKKGVSMQSVEKYVTKYLDTTFWNLLIENFALKSEVKALEHRVDTLQAYIELGKEATPEQIADYIARLQSERTGELVKTSHGTICRPEYCIKLTNGQ